MCGLSNNYPFCDGAHKHAKQQEDEGKQYVFDGETAIEVSDKIQTREV
jgi:CDGSH-type Zn-finger protein